MDNRYKRINFFEHLVRNKKPDKQKELHIETLDQSETQKQGGSKKKEEIQKQIIKIPLEDLKKNTENVKMLYRKLQNKI